ncbi:MAG: hypothetical protein N4J56_007726 [Chroococcidiopsis sp. SAG 2025]|nr:hypothetical protein [Chroococcidiopsis sp. SAG 2025]
MLSVSHAPRSTGIKQRNHNEHTIHPLPMVLSRLEARAPVLSGRASPGSLWKLDRHEDVGENRIAPWRNEGNPLPDL